MIIYITLPYITPPLNNLFGAPSFLGFRSVSKNIFKHGYRVLLSLLLIATQVACSSLQKSDSNSNSQPPYETQPSTPSVVGFEEQSDPLFWWNRPVFYFNHYLYCYALSPISRGYKKIVPTPVKTGISQFFLNLREPIYFVNHVFQGEFKSSFVNLTRFGINSTIGIAGIWDISGSHFDIPRDATNFNETFIRLGVEHGAYLVLPVLGPSDLRGAPSTLLDTAIHPFQHMNNQALSRDLTLSDGFISQAPTLSEYPSVVEEAEDPYLYIREFYLQSVQRDEQAIRSEINPQEAP